MKPFVVLLERVASSAPDELAPLVGSYLAGASHADAGAALFLLLGGRLTRAVSPSLLAEAVRERTKVPDWLFEESRAEVGDLAETIALVGSSGSACREPLARLFDEVASLSALPESDRLDRVLGWLDRYDAGANRLLVALALARRIARVPRRAIASGLAASFGLDPRIVEHRLAQGASPSPEAFGAIVREGEDEDVEALPYGFELARRFEEFDARGRVSEWRFEPKLDGVRGQIVRRSTVGVWNRRFELVSSRFPAIARAAASLPSGTVLDGELVVFVDGVPSYAALDVRLAPSPPSAARLRREPASFVAFDVLEHRGEDVRDRSLEERRSILAGLLPLGPIVASEELRFSSWRDADELRRASRARGVEGLVLKRRGSPYRAGRDGLDWWKWPADPHAIDAVLVYAERKARSDERRYASYTFAVRGGDGLVPVGATGEGLSLSEIAELDAWIDEHTTERFGPVRAVEPELVFELVFTSLSSNRRKRSGVDLRRLRIARWRRDKPASEADSIGDVRGLLAHVEPVVSKGRSARSLR